MCAEDLKPYVHQRSKDPGPLPCGFISAELMNLASCARWSAETAGRKGLLETVQGCPTPKYIPYSVNGAKFVSVIRGQEGERYASFSFKPMDVEANSHGKVDGMFIRKAKVTAHIACAPSLMSQELTTIFHTEVASTGCRREKQEIQVH